MQGPRSLTEGSIPRGLLLFALPMLYGNLLQAMNASINAVWVGRFLGEAALTATANGNMVLFLLLGGVMGLSMAATILIGQHVGARRMDEARKAVGTSATFFLGLSTGMAAVGFFACEQILRAMSTPAQALPLAVAYMEVTFLALPFLYMYAFAMAVLRGAGDSKTPLRFLLLSVALDIVLTPLLIFGTGPLPELGIRGAALATLIAQAIGLGALLTHLYRRDHPLLLHGPDLRLLRMQWPIIGVLVRKGIPMGLQVVVISVSGVLMLTLVNRFGVDTAAAYGAAFQVWSYIQMPAFALGMAVSAMAAQNVGAQRWERVHATARWGVLYAVVLTTALVVLVEVFSAPALGIFLPPGSPALPIAEHLNFIAAWSFVFFGVSLVLLGVVRATGAVMVPLLILTLSLLVLRYPVALAMLGAWQADAIWWSFPLSTFASASLAALYYRFGNWRHARMVGGPSGGPPAQHPGTGRPAPAAAD
jgi:putative MATE family efflux protein